MIRVTYVAAIAFAAGLGSGSVITWWRMSGAEAKAELRDVRQADTSARAVRTQQRVVATAFEATRDHIDSDHQEAADGLQPYLDARPDLRAIDLGDDWLCLVAKADGKPCGPSTGRADGAVPTAAGPAANAGQDAARIPGHAPAVPAVRSAPGGADASREPTAQH